MKSFNKRTGFKIVTIGIAFMCVLMCGLMYISFRPDTLKMFHFFKVFGLLDYLEELQHNPARVPSWILYNLPDGAWLFAYSILIACFWNFKLKDCWMFILVMPFICIPHEFLQGLGVMHGTYDPSDVLAYLLAIFAGFVYIYIVHSLAFKKVDRVERRRKSTTKLVLTTSCFALFVLLAIGSDDTVGRISAGTGEVNAVEELWR
jgi:hypothetical protein